jgi:hypothetical protein
MITDHGNVSKCFSGIMNNSVSDSLIIDKYQMCFMCTKPNSTNSINSQFQKRHLDIFMCYNNCSKNEIKTVR